MSLVKWVFVAVLVLPAAELAAFLVVVALIGWIPAVALFIATSIIGVMLLRKSGRQNLAQMRAAFTQDGIRSLHLETPGASAVLGGILLVFPGFITDVLGAMLLLPPVRRWFAGMIARRAEAAAARRRQDEHIIDLEPSEWRALPDQRRNRRRTSPADNGVADNRTRRRGA
jgi:UPF0716 protein FxsA